VKSAASPVDRLQWFAPGVDPERPRRAGVKPSGGGIHHTKTLMLAELTAYLQAAGTATASAHDLVMSQNVLGKRTSSARKIALSRLGNLYSIRNPVPIFMVQSALWQIDAEGRPMLALLTALARDAILRDSADTVLPAALGTPIR